MNGCSARCGGCVTSATPCWWWSMTRIRSAPPIIWWISAPAAGARRRGHRPGHPAEVAANPASLTGDYLAGRRRDRRCPEAAAGDGKRLKIGAPAATTCKNVNAEIPAGHLHLRHRRLRQRQVHADPRHLYKTPARQLMGAGSPGRMTRSRGSSISTRSSTSTSRRSAAPRAPTRRPTPASSRRSATGSPSRRKAGRAATSPGASASTSRAGAARRARATA